MKRYLGIKQILAKSMTRADYNNYRNWELPEDENGSDEGFLVEYIDGGQANHPEHQGYISWSPKEIFEKAYHKINGLTFGNAIQALKAGEKVSRRGWNGKGIFLGLHIPTKYSVMTAQYIYIDTSELQTDNIDAPKVIVPWLPSQTDMLAEDWDILIG